MISLSSYLFSIILFIMRALILLKNMSIAAPIFSMLKASSSDSWIPNFYYQQTTISVTSKESISILQNFTFFFNSLTSPINKDGLHFFITCKTFASTSSSSGIWVGFEDDVKVLQLVYNKLPYFRLLKIHSNLLDPDMGTLFRQIQPEKLRNKQLESTLLLQFSTNFYSLQIPFMNTAIFLLVIVSMPHLPIYLNQINLISKCINNYEWSPEYLAYLSYQFFYLIFRYQSCGCNQNTWIFNLKSYHDLCRSFECGVEDVAIFYTLGFTKLKISNYNKMQSKGHRLSNEILGIQTPLKTALPALDYQSIIIKQQKLIQQLQHEIKCLRQYVKYCMSDKQNESESETDCSLRNDQSAQKELPDSKTLLPINSNASRDSGLKNLVKQIMQLIQAENIDVILTKLRAIAEKANRKNQPIFVERIKIKEVAVPVEIIKQVQKQVIVYQEKIVEVPIFRQKIVEKYVNRPMESSAPVNTNSSSSNQSKSSHTYEDTEVAQRERQKQREKDKEQDFMKKKLNFVQSPRHNQTYNMKSPRFKEKEEHRNNFMKSPRYKAKDNS